MTIQSLRGMKLHRASRWYIYIYIFTCTSMTYMYFAHTYIVFYMYWYIVYMYVYMYMYTYGTICSYMFMICWYIHMCNILRINDTYIHTYIHIHGYVTQATLPLDYKRIEKKVAKVFNSWDTTNTGDISYSEFITPEVYIYFFFI